MSRRDTMSDATAEGSEACGRVPLSHSTLHTTYFSQYKRRLRKGVAAPPPDAAGLLGGALYHGRNTPVKGKGTPPPDQHEKAFIPGRHNVPGKSFVQTMNVMSHSEGPMPDVAPVRLSLKLTEQSFRSQLAGGAACVTSQPAAHKPHRRVIPATVQTARVLCLAEGDDADPGESSTYAYYSSLRAGGFATRPSTAPPCVLRGNTAARKQYEQCAAGHADVFQYRHSGGICPDEYKMVMDRQSAPQTAPPATGASRDTFFDRRREYDMNRMRSFMSQSIIPE